MKNSGPLRVIIQVIVFTALTAGAVLGTGCGSSDTVSGLSALERYALGMEKFRDEDYLDAYNEFNIIKLQFPGSNVADSAQLYMGECRYRREEYLIAAEEFQALRRNFPASPLLPEAQYKIALCYYDLAPKSVLDQRYTDRAIDELQAFIEYYPTHPLAQDAAGKIQELNGRLAKKDFETAELYMKMEYYKAATYYYNAVFEKYHDTPYGEQALVGKVRSLIARKRFTEAVPDVEKFKELYPQSAYIGEIQRLEQEIIDQSTTDPPASTPGEQTRNRS